MTIKLSKASIILDIASFIFEFCLLFSAPTNPKTFQIKIFVTF
jgi:hypothetical protein